MIYEYKGYRITDDYDEYLASLNYSSEILEAMELSYSLTQKGKPNGIKKVHRLAKKYKNVPRFLSNLVSYYTKKDPEKAIDCAEILVERFPNFFIGRTQLAESYLRARYYDDVLSPFNDTIDITGLVDNKQLILDMHIVMYFVVISLYFIYTGKLKYKIKMEQELVNIFGENSTQVDSYDNMIVKELRLLSLVD
jgi:tetratricopeptide (TPR) repeat protein